MSYHDSRVSKRKTSSSFLAKFNNERLSQLRWWKVTILWTLNSSNGLFVYYNFPTFFSLFKEFPSPFRAWTCTWFPIFPMVSNMVADLNYNYLLIPYKPIFTAQITGHVFVLGQHKFGGRYKLCFWICRVWGTCGIFM